MESHIEKLFSEAHRQSYERGKAEGMAEAETRSLAKAVMMILKRRGLALADQQQQQIIACTDVATLDRWLERALSVTSVDEVFA